MKKSYSFVRNKKRFQRIKMYYLYEKKWLSVVVTYPMNIPTEKLSEITTIKNRRVGVSKGGEDLDGKVRVI